MYVVNIYIYIYNKKKIRIQIMFKLKWISIFGIKIQNGFYFKIDRQ